jgi:hypothetical protein
VQRPQEVGQRFSVYPAVLDGHCLLSKKSINFIAIRHQALTRPDRVLPINSKGGQSYSAHFQYGATIAPIASSICLKVDPGLETVV